MSAILFCSFPCDDDEDKTYDPEDTEVRFGGGVKWGRGSTLRIRQKLLQQGHIDSQHERH